MLYVYDTGSVRLGEGKSLRDDDRKITFEYVGGGAMGALHVFRLTWGNRVVPVQAWTDPYGDGRGSRLYEQVSVNAAHGQRFGMEGHLFASTAEQREAELIAVECLLAFGSYYDGLTNEPGYRAQLRGEEFQLADFGYQKTRIPIPSMGFASMSRSNAVTTTRRLSGRSSSDLDLTRALDLRRRRFAVASAAVIAGLGFTVAILFEALAR